MTKRNKMNYEVNEQGFYGDFGGAFIPEMLHHNVNELKENYLHINFETSLVAFLKSFKTSNP